MAPPTDNDEPHFRFVVKIMPPRRPANSLFRRALQQPKPEEPLHIIAVPARASETFADVWKNIKERYQRNYGAEEVAKGWFHKLQDRYGADIDSHDGVGELGYTVNSHRDDLVLIMLQNDIDRDGSVPETSGLRPPGFTKPELTAEQEQQAKRRKVEEERYGGALEDIDEDTPIESRERSLGPGSQELDAQGDSARKIDADGFAVPALPGSISRKRKRSSKPRGDIIQSSMEGENEDDVLVQDSQTKPRDEDIVTGSLPENASTSRARTMKSVPAEATAGASSTGSRASRAQTTAPKARSGGLAQGTLQLGKSTHSHAGSSKPQANVDGRQSQPRSPPTPVSTTSQTFTQPPPESAQRPKPTPTILSTPANQKVQREAAQDSLDFDPIEDDDLLQGITGTADDSFAELDIGQADETELSTNSTQKAAKPGKLPKPGKLKKLSKPSKIITSTPKVAASSSGKHAFTPTNNALERLSGTQGSTGKNPRSQSGQKLFWTPEEDSYLLQGLRYGLSAAEIIRRFGLGARTTSAVRGRINLLKKDPKVANLKGVSEAPDDEDSSVLSASKHRRPWSVDEIRLMSRAIADGLDALEIQAKHFPQRSEDSINRKVISIQDQVWKNASKDPMFPENGANLEGWTLKDSCKLWRTNREGLLTQNAKQRFFGRWKMSEVQKQLDAYKAKLQRLKSEQARASQVSKSAQQSFIDSSQLLAESSQLPANSSPVERSMQARAARRSSVEPPRAVAIQVPSSPPQSVENDTTSIKPQDQTQTYDQGQRGSSPTVRITTTEQDTARSTLSQIPSASGKQSTLRFSRDKGKQRAGEPRPSFEELDAQYTRHSATNSTDRQSTQAQSNLSVVDSRDENRPEDHDDDTGPTPLDDLEMLDANIENGLIKSPEAKKSSAVPVPIGGTTSRASRSTPAGLNATAKEYASGSKASRNDQIPVDTSSASSEGRRTRSSETTLQSPITTREGTASTSSVHRRRSRVETGVDTRVAAQLSQELNRSLSREEMEEESNENQVMQTPNPKIKRYRKTPVSHKTAPLSQEAISKEDFAVAHETQPSQTQAFQTQDSTTTRSQRVSRAAVPADIAPKNVKHEPAQSRKPAVLQPSPQLGTSDHSGTPVTTPATTPATSGKLPARGQSYASKIRDIHRGTQPKEAGVPKTAITPANNVPTGGISQPAPTNRSLPPTDAELWEKTANAEALGKNRQEYFEDLKISTYSIRAMGRADWEEVKRLKAEERRLRRQRRIAKDTYVPSARDTQHPDGPAQGGNTEQADEDVIRADDDSNVSSEKDNMEFDEEIWSDADFEQPEEVDQDRHFSEVEDEDGVTAPNEVSLTRGKLIEAPQGVDHNRHFSEVKDDEEMLDASVEGAPQVSGVDAGAEHADDAEEDDLELPTVPTMPAMSGDGRHALTDEHLQELNNSGEEGSPTRLSRKRKANQNESSPKSKRSKLDSDRAAMPPPQSAASAKRESKRRFRRSRHRDRRNSESGSDRRSSFSLNHPSSDAPEMVGGAVESTAAKDSSTPAKPNPSAHRSKRAKVEEPTPVKASTKVSTKTPKQSTAAAASQSATQNTFSGSQRTSVGGGGIGLAGLVRKAHIPTPPKAKTAPQKESKKKFDIRADDDESEESEDSE
jgi:hypothetical protein